MMMMSDESSTVVPNRKIATTSAHSHFAGRLPAGSAQPVVLMKDGNKHIRRNPNGDVEEILSVGLACSEIFSGPRLAKILQPGFAYEQKVMMDLTMSCCGDGSNNNKAFAAPLSIHTSGGVPEALSTFIEALEPHLPWKDKNFDWCLSLQLEGASAVWAAIDMLLQTRNDGRKLVAVGQVSYHGPPSTSFGSKIPLWEKPHQVTYPVPIAGMDEKESLSSESVAAHYIDEFRSFLDENGNNVGVMLIEPQWGSSQAALPWPADLLKQYIAMAKARGILVVCDEIMCGLGRHGRGSLFVSKALDLDPDAITFGKAIGGGVYPISGAILKRGRDVLCRNGRSVLQSHTYSGSSVRALMTATEVLREIPNWYPSIEKSGNEMERIFHHLGAISDGMLVTHGQGMMWGAVLTKEGKMGQKQYRDWAVSCLRKYCNEVGVLPYIVPCGGFMCSPLFDIDVDTIHEVGRRLEQVVVRTINEIQWTSSTKSMLLTPSSSSTTVASLLDEDDNKIIVVSESLPAPPTKDMYCNRPESPRSVNKAHLIA